MNEQQNELERLRQEAAPKSSQERGKLIRVGAAAVLCAVLILGLTMWLVPWATMTAAGVLVGVAALGLSAVLLWAVAGREKAALSEKQIDRKDERVQDVRSRAFALAGKAALCVSFLAALLLCIFGKIGTTAFCLTALGFLVLVAVTGAAIWLLEKKL